MVLSGSITGPDDVVKPGPDGDIAVVDRYTAEVVLVFRGQPFDVVAEFALVDRTMRWLAACG